MTNNKIGANVRNTCYCSILGKFSELPRIKNNNAQKFAKANFAHEQIRGL